MHVRLLNPVCLAFSLHCAVLYLALYLPNANLSFTRANISKRLVYIIKCYSQSQNIFKLISILGH